jgi:imidazolonepropionase-like amidohydrolase
MHVDHFIDIGMRELHRGGATDLPDVLASGYQLRPDMFVFEPFLLDFPELANLVRTKVTGVQSVRRLVQANARHGVDQIKILATERAGTPDSDPRRQTFTENEMTAIVAEAQASGLSVAAHAHGDEGAAAAVRSGVSTIEHGSFLSDATIVLMKEHDTCLVPTVGMEDAVIKAPYFQNATPEFRERSKASFGARRDAASRAWRKGIRIAAGTDTNLINVSTEVAALVKIGMPPMDAIKAATSQAAGCLGIGSRTGSIRPGFEADLLVMDTDPLGDITALQKVVLVINDGKIAIDQLGKR